MNMMNSDANPRPYAMTVFDYLFTFMLALSIIAVFVTLPLFEDTVNLNPELRKMGITSGYLVKQSFIGLSIFSICWFFFSKKGNKLARWALIVQLGMTIFGFAIGIATGKDVPENAPIILRYIIYIITLLEILLIYFISRNDVKNWCNNKITNQINYARILYVAISIYIIYSAIMLPYRILHPAWKDYCIPIDPKKRLEFEHKAAIAMPDLICRDGNSGSR